MAAATVTNRRKTSVAGDLVRIDADTVEFAATADTWDTGLNVIREINMTPTTNSSYGFTISGGVITLVSGGAVTFRGGVLGLF